LQAKIGLWIKVAFPSNKSTGRPVRARRWPAIVAQIRRRWEKTRIVLQADSGFARDDLMAWCEENGVAYIFGLALQLHCSFGMGFL
jgi:hypothetical protein